MYDTDSSGGFKEELAFNAVDRLNIHKYKFGGEYKWQ